VFLRRHRVDQHDLQGNILCGYGREFRHGLYFFVRVTDERAGQTWLRKLSDQVTDAVPWDSGFKPLSTLNVALTYSGLEHIGVPKPILCKFPEEFKVGMGDRDRARRLGDVGESDPNGWEEGLRPGEPDILVTITAQDGNVLVLRRSELRRDASVRGLEIVHEQEATPLETGRGKYSREHFGFADGFSQPAIRGNSGPDTRDGMGTPRRWGRWSAVAPGEFVLGYPGEDGLLAAAPEAPLGRSGSFMVVRKLQQHVGRFASYMEEMVEQCYVKEAAKRDLRTAANGDSNEVSLWDREQWVASRIVGRWRDGRALVLSKQPPGAEGAERETDRAVINRFRYDRDEDGFACPLGAHIRRANPRDALGWRGQLTKRHRITRRGMPYGPPAFDPAQAPDKPGGLFGVEDDDTPRGLMFVCFQASIARQFEVIQERWLNDGDAFWLGDEKDFLTISANQGAGGGGVERQADNGQAPIAKMTVQGTPPCFLTPQPSFVTTKGGGYFFVPGLTALRALATAYWR
jgi:Dyp-type peroxidase family